MQNVQNPGFPNYAPNGAMQVPAQYQQMPGPPGFPAAPQYGYGGMGYANYQNPFYGNCKHPFYIVIDYSPSLFPLWNRNLETCVSFEYNMLL